MPTKARMRPRRRPRHRRATELLDKLHREHMSQIPQVSVEPVASDPGCLLRSPSGPSGGLFGLHQLAVTCLSAAPATPNYRFWSVHYSLLLIAVASVRSCIRQILYLVPTVINLLTAFRPAALRSRVTTMLHHLRTQVDPWSRQMEGPDRKSDTSPSLVTRCV